MTDPHATPDRAAEDLVDRVARAICLADQEFDHARQPDHPAYQPPFETMEQTGEDDLYRAEARAAIKVIEEMTP